MEYPIHKDLLDRFVEELVWFSLTTHGVEDGIGHGEAPEIEGESIERLQRQDATSNSQHQRRYIVDVL